MGVAGQCAGVGEFYRTFGDSDARICAGVAVERTEADYNGGETGDESLEAAEREHILQALRESHGHIGGLRGAAMRLGLKRTTLQSKLKHLGIHPRPGTPGR